MKTISMDVFYDEISKLLDVVYDSQHENITKAADIMANSIANGGVIHVFGSGHSVGFGLEMKNRIGSLACIHSIQTTDFVVKGKITLEDLKDPDNIFERRPGIADKMYDLYDMHASDCFIIISNSGINGLVIDMAIKAREKGHKVIVVTSWQHTNAEDSRHPSGKKLYQLGDVVIDNCGPQGDALLQTDSVEKVCSVSSITGACIAQTLTSETCQLLKEKGLEAPILWDESLHQAQEHNDAIRNKYQGRV
ncbi:MAG: sugar isomerase domain-containing protein [Erysipelotrichaceae bacterium]